MNRFIWVLLPGILTVTACSKTSSAKEHKFTATWRQVSGNDGGITGFGYTVPPDSLFILSLNTDSSYVFTQNGRAGLRGTYSMAPFTPPAFPDSNTKIIVFKDRRLWRRNLAHLIPATHLGADTLTITSMDIEGPSATYIRLTR